ncbi:MAG TPA: phosphoenolpyruvate synthase [Longimicrobiales bacterium]|nr:phosphoenolpyruvate synthase [Longimicrobiales bacterium]
MMNSADVLVAGSPLTLAARGLRRKDAGVAGGKGANLGEMAGAGFPVPQAFVVSVDAFRSFLDASGLNARLAALLKDVNVDDAVALQSAAQGIRDLVVAAEIPPTVRSAVLEAYRGLKRADETAAPFVAVRSSATVEDSAEYSFAGMFESFLNVHGDDDLLAHVRQCWASAFGARVLYYRARQQVPGDALIAVVVQRMVDSEKAGVMFTVNPATGDASAVVIEAAFGLGEVVVAGTVTPDRFEVDKRTGRVRLSQIAQKEFMLRRGETGGNVRVPLSEADGGQPVLGATDIGSLARLAVRLEEHYGVPQDIEWAIEAGEPYIVQTRPITTLDAAAAPPDPGDGRVLVRGLAASPGRAAGAVRGLGSPQEAGLLEPGEVLVTAATSPDWVPIMRRAAAIVTDTGGMTSHAAIVSRELGIPCIVGTKDGTRVLQTGAIVTVDAARGLVLAGSTPASADPGAAPATTAAVARSAPVTATRLYVNLGDPARLEEVAALPVDGVGLLRAEFLILETLAGLHPRLLLERGQGGEFVARMSAQLERFAAAFHPRPVTYRAMDFRSNEFRGLEGGDRFEPEEANPMIGYRGCARYIRDPELFRLELEVLKTVRGRFTNLHLMLPFVRTGSEFEACMSLVREAGLAPGRDFDVWVMAEVPSVVHWLATYARLGATGVSIGSNDLTQLVLGVDRDSTIIADTFDERDDAVRATIALIIGEARRAGIPCSICGQAPSVYPEYAAWLVERGISSISVTPDAVERTRLNIAAAEQRVLLEHARGD